MMLPPKKTPPLQRAKTEPPPHCAYTKAEKVHVSAVSSLCKTYMATLNKLTTVFKSLSEMESTKVSSIDDAIRAGNRDEMMKNISQQLACGVEDILRTKDLPSLRAGVLHDLRERFEVAAPPAKADSETQTVRTRERKPKPSEVPGDGGDGEAVAAPQPVAAAGGNEEAVADQGAPRKLHRAFSFADRQIAWELKKLAKIQEQREEKEQQETNK